MKDPQLFWGKALGWLFTIGASAGLAGHRENRITATRRKRNTNMIDLNTATPDALAARQKLLENEIDANEEETRMYQEELNQVYAEQDRRKSS